MATRDQLTAMLNTLEAQLPGMVASYQTDGEFWIVFAGDADLIAGVAQACIQAMLVKHGRYLATIG